MNRAQIQELQKRIGATPDGFWGPKSIARCQAYLRSLMPSNNPWPSQDQKSLTRFYGDPGDESKLTNINVSQLGVFYSNSRVNTIRVNKACADSLLIILKEIADSKFSYILREFAGVYNNRAMRGGSLPSLHARGAAIDLSPGKNGLKTSWPVSSTMPIEVMEIFSKRGWLSAGAFWSRDAMHFQATK
jgi:hypothetical protein